MSFAKGFELMAAEHYRYVKFNEIENFQKVADEMKVMFKDIPVAVSVAAV